MLSLGGHHGGSPSTSRVRGETGSRSGSVQGRRSGEIIVEEEEDEDEDVEEVDEFSPVKEGTGEVVVEEEEPESEGVHLELAHTNSQGNGMEVKT
jgi:hypothetical protein